MRDHKEDDYETRDQLYNLLMAERQRTAKLMERLSEATARAERAEEVADKRLQEAQIWKMEASTQASIVREIYQAITGSTGEPGDWNGAGPVRALLAAKERAEAELKKAREQEPFISIDRLNRNGSAKFSINPKYVGRPIPTLFYAAPIPAPAAQVPQEWRDALSYAIKEADGWHDEARGGTIQTWQMVQARALLQEEVKP